MSSITATIPIDSLAYGGDGVGRIGDKIVFVPETVPGDIARIAVVEDRGTFFRGVLEQVETPSQARIEPFCPFADRCGGCQWQMIDYIEQLDRKQAIVEESLRRIGGIDDTTVESCLPSPMERS